MKKILLAIFALLPVLTAFAQTDFNPETKTIDPYSMGGARLGFAQFIGDVSNNSFFAKLSKESKPSFEINVSRQFTPAFSVKVDYSKSTYFSKAKLVWQGTPLDLSANGSVSEYGIYGTLNLNKLLSKNKETGENWFVYVSSGLGMAGWRNKLKDEDNNIIIDSVGYSAAGKSTKMTAMSVPFTLGVNFQVTDGVWVSLEHSYHFVNSDRMDGYLGGLNDIYTTSSFGITAKLDKIVSIFKHGERDNTPTYSMSTSRPTQVEPTKVKKTRSSRGIPKVLPEIQDYTGYNALIPPPLPKKDTSRNRLGGANSDKNVWMNEADSGRFEITGGGKYGDRKIISGAAPVIISGGISKSDNNTDSEAKTGIVPTYRVQIQASKTYIEVDQALKKMTLNEKVSVELRKDGWYRYYVGQFSTLPEARAKLKELRAQGLKDAFIVSFKSGVRKAIKE